MALVKILVFCALYALTEAIPLTSVERQVTKLRDSYDFIIAGGGTTGLTVADRLTEAFPNRPSLPLNSSERSEQCSWNLLTHEL